MAAYITLRQGSSPARYSSRRTRPTKMQMEPSNAEKIRLQQRLLEQYKAEQEFLQSVGSLEADEIEHQRALLRQYEIEHYGEANASIEEQPEVSEARSSYHETEVIGALLGLTINPNMNGPMVPPKEDIPEVEHQARTVHIRNMSVDSLSSPPNSPRATITTPITTVNEQYFGQASSPLPSSPTNSRSSLIISQGGVRTWPVVLETGDSDGSDTEEELEMINLLHDKATKEEARLALESEEKTLVKLTQKLEKLVARKSRYTDAQHICLLKLVTCHKRLHHWQKTIEVGSPLLEAENREKFSATEQLLLHQALAESYMAMNDLERASQFCSKAHKASRKVHGKTHERYYQILALKVRILSLKGDTEEAEAYLAVLPEAYHEAAGVTPMFELSSGVDETIVVQQQAQHHQAQQQQQQSESLLSQLYRPHMEPLLTSLHELGVSDEMIRNNPDFVKDYIEQNGKALQLEHNDPSGNRPTSFAVELEANEADANAIVAAPGSWIH